MGTSTDGVPVKKLTARAIAHGATSIIDEFQDIVTKAKHVETILTEVLEAQRDSLRALNVNRNRLQSAAYRSLENENGFGSNGFARSVSPGEISADGNVLQEPLSNLPSNFPEVTWVYDPDHDPEPRPPPSEHPEDQLLASIRSPLGAPLTSPLGSGGYYGISSKSLGNDVESDRVPLKWFDLSCRLLDRCTSIGDASSKAIQSAFVDARGSLECLRPVWASAERPALSGASTKYYCVESMEDAPPDSSSGRRHRSGSPPLIIRLLQRLVINPSSFRRMFWELLGLTALMYDTISLPLEVFDYDKTEFAELVRYVISTYWLLDLFSSFFSGYMEDGVAEMDLLKVWRRYVFGWFVVDVTVVSADWILLLLNAATSSFAVARMVKTNRFIRVVRLMRVARVSQMSQMYANLRTLFFSDALITFFNIICLLLLPVMLSHFIACGWYYIGSEELESAEDSWMYHLEFSDRSKLTLYWTCFHWAIAQYTPAPNNIHPVTRLERLFAIGVLLSGFIFFTSFLGSVTSMVTAARVETKKRMLEESQVRQFIRDHRVSFKLSHQVMAITKQHHVHHTVLVEPEIPVFKTLPESVLVRLRFEVYSSHMRRHPVFDHMMSFDYSCLIRLANFAVSPASHGRFAEIFNFGHPGEAMYFVTHGTLHYRPGLLKRMDPQRNTLNTAELGAGSHLSEPALWLDWHHQGRAFTRKWCNVFSVHLKEFTEICSEQVRVFDALRHYARAYSTKIVELHGREVVEMIKGESDSAKRAYPLFNDLGLEGSVVHSLAEGMLPFSDSEGVFERPGNRFREVWRSPWARVGAAMSITQTMSASV